jgi:hypothetical protein
VFFVHKKHEKTLAKNSNQQTNRKPFIPQKTKHPSESLLSSEEDEQHPK